MAKKKEKTTKLKEIEAPLPPLSPLFTNLAIALGHPDMVMLDFGFIAPSYAEPHDIEDSHLARICMPWDIAEIFCESLQEAISTHKATKPKRRPRRKS